MVAGELFNTLTICDGMLYPNFNGLHLRSLISHLLFVFFHSTVI